MATLILRLPSFKRYLLENGVDVDHIIEIALDGIENEESQRSKVCFKYIKDAMKDDGSIISPFEMKCSSCHDLRKCWTACSAWAILMCMSPEVIPSSCPATLWPNSVAEVMRLESTLSPLQSFILSMTAIMMMPGMTTWSTEDVCDRKFPERTTESGLSKEHLCKWHPIWRMLLKEIRFRTWMRLGFWLMSLHLQSVNRRPTLQRLPIPFASERQMTYANKPSPSISTIWQMPFWFSRQADADIKGESIGANLEILLYGSGTEMHVWISQQEPTISWRTLFITSCWSVYNVDVGVVDIFDMIKRATCSQAVGGWLCGESRKPDTISRLHMTWLRQEKQTQEFNSLRNIPDSFKRSSL